MGERLYEPGQWVVAAFGMYAPSYERVRVMVQPCTNLFSYTCSRNGRLCSVFPDQIVMPRSGRR